MNEHVEIVPEQHPVTLSRDGDYVVIEQNNGSLDHPIPQLRVHIDNLPKMLARLRQFEGTER